MIYAYFLFRWVTLGVLSVGSWHFFRKFRRSTYFPVRYIVGLLSMGYLVFLAGSLLGLYSLLVSPVPQLSLLDWDAMLLSLNAALAVVAWSVFCRVFRGWEEVQIRRWIYADLWFVVLATSVLFASREMGTSAPHLGLLVLCALQLNGAQWRALFGR